ncbi:phosphotransferase [Rhodococcus artemisiae]|uniref:Phosphotransferase n=1 Tax=Rhodococcus artemisiae TaxID=714159 RepID=A0ABU7LCT7_9NOCA|nr:phosphotransferase [Rhodococcus artemisiae]MEE2059344.1 phosphotransferase [Rhodococcus artemisiae]
MTVAVPDTLDEALSPQWLTSALQPRFPGIEVTSATLGPIVDRVSTNARFTIECTSGIPEGLSPDLCVKGYFNEEGRTTRAAGEPEACFYRDLRDHIGARTLRSHYADFDPDTRHGVVITEDIVSQNSIFLDAASSYTADQVAESLGEFAKLHAATWGKQNWGHQQWLAPRLTGAIRAMGTEEITARIDRNFHGPNGIRVPDEMKDAPRLLSAYLGLVDALASEYETSDWCVIHGDAHVGNIYLDGQSRPSLVDWQLVQRGMWYMDVGTHIATALTPEERRRTEDDLLAHYLDCLASQGIEPPPFDSGRRALRRGMVRGLYLWGITVKVEPRLIEILLHRLSTAVADHDALSTELFSTPC